MDKEQDIENVMSLKSEDTLEIVDDEDSNEVCEEPLKSLIPLKCAVPCNAVLNLDVSTMIAHVSNMTNGHCQMNFDCRFLTQQAQKELVSPIRPILDTLFQGRTLVSCKSAISRFNFIVSRSAGGLEKKRAEEFLVNVNVIPDCETELLKYLKIGKSITELSKTIFCTGDFYGAITVTGNFHFLLAAKSQGVNFHAFVHESRSLSEQKEIHS